MMKRFKYFSIYFASGLMLMTVTLSSCKKDFFDLEDTTGIDSRIWNDEGAVGLFLNRTYNLIIPIWPAPDGLHNTSDEMWNNSTANQDFLYGRLAENSVTDIGTSAGNNGNRYYDIRRCNVAIAGLDTSTINPGSIRLFKEKTRLYTSGDLCAHGKYSRKEFYLPFRCSRYTGVQLQIGCVWRSACPLPGAKVHCH